MSNLSNSREPGVNRKRRRLWPQSSHRAAQPVTLEMRRTLASAVIVSPPSDAVRQDPWATYAVKETGLGLDCPIRAGPDGQSLCGWRPLDGADGFPSLTRMKAHVGSHGMVCPNCSRSFQTHNHFASHVAYRPCSEANADTRRPKHPLLQSTQEINEFFGSFKNNRELPVAEQWMVGYKCLHSDWHNANRSLPSPYYRENASRAREPQIRRIQSSQISFYAPTQYTEHDQRPDVSTLSHDDRNMSVHESMHEGHAADGDDTVSSLQEARDKHQVRSSSRPAQRPSMLEQTGHDDSSAVYDAADEIPSAPLDFSQWDSSEFESYLADMEATQPILQPPDTSLNSPMGPSEKTLSSGALQSLGPSDSPASATPFIHETESVHLDMHGSSRLSGRGLKGGGAPDEALADTIMYDRGQSTQQSDKLSLPRSTFEHDSAMASSYTQERDHAAISTQLRDEIEVLCNDIERLRTHGRSIQLKTRKCGRDLRVDVPDRHEMIRATYVNGMIEMFKNEDVF